MAKDLALNAVMSTFLDPDTKDVAVVEGQDAFEQAVTISLHKLERELLGETDRNSLTQKLRLAVTRVAQQYDEIDNIDQLVIQPSASRPDAYTVRVVYDVGNSFEEEVSI